MDPGDRKASIRATTPKSPLSGQQSFCKWQFLHFKNHFLSLSSYSLTGGLDISTPFDGILELNTTTMQWKEIGKMGAARGQHSMTAVDVIHFGCSL